MAGNRKLVPVLRRRLPAVLLVWAIAGHTLTSMAAESAGKEPVGYAFSVRALHAAELPKDRSDAWMQFFAPGVASGALGLAAPPMYASALVVGGVILAPAALILSSMDRRMRQRMVNALEASDFEGSLLRAAEARALAALPAAVPVDPAATVRVELVINAYGLASQRLDQVCFVASLDVIARHAGNEALRDRLNISPIERSADAPPPQCASHEMMAENDGQMVRTTAAIYAEVLAVMIVDRLLAQSKP